MLPLLALIPAVMSAMGAAKGGYDLAKHVSDDTQKKSGGSVLGKIGGIAGNALSAANPLGGAAIKLGSTALTAGGKMLENNSQKPEVEIEVSSSSQPKITPEIKEKLIEQLIKRGRIGEAMKLKTADL